MNTWIFALVLCLYTQCEAYLVPAITHQFIVKYFEYKEKKKATTPTKYERYVEVVPRRDATEAVIEGMSQWLKAEIGKVDAKSHFANFETYNSDGVLKCSCFDHSFAVPCPKKGLGSYLKMLLKPHVYLSLGWGDPNGCKNKIGQDTPFHLKEYFRMIQAGYEDKTFGHLYVAAWNQDRLRKKKKPSGYGVISHFERVIGSWVPFMRYSYVHGRCFDIERSLSVGLGYKNPFLRKGDSIGLAGTWGHPYGKNWRDQTTLETYYKYYLTPKLSVTPHLQFNYHPYKNQEHEAEAAFGIRFNSSF